MKKIMVSVVAVALSLVMGMLSSATDYTLSVNQKKAPKLISEKVEIIDPVTGEITVLEDAVATVKVGGKIVHALNQQDIIVTAVSQIDKIENKLISEALRMADKAMKAGEVLKNVSDKYVRNEEYYFEKQAERLLSKLGYPMGKYTNPNSAKYRKAYEELIVRDLFDISLVDSITQIKQLDGALFYNADMNVTDGSVTEGDESATITAKFAVGLSAAEPTPIVIFKCDTLDTWETMSSENVIRNDDGSMTLTFERFCVVALLTANPYTEEGNEVTSPETGVKEVNHAVDGLAFLAVVCFVIADVLTTAWIKNKRKHTC